MAKKKFSAAKAKHLKSTFVGGQFGSVTYAYGVGYTGTREETFCYRYDNTFFLPKMDDDGFLADSTFVEVTETEAVES